MPGAPARLAVAERAAGSKPTQDRTVLLPDAVAVLDGASAPDPAERDGGEQRRHRNRPAGYWSAEATPTAAGQAITRSWTRAAVTAALLASDGVSRGIGRAVPDWTAALRLVRAPEQADPDGRRWPRSKPYDDQALIVVILDEEGVGNY